MSRQAKLPRCTWKKTSTPINSSLCGHSAATIAKIYPTLTDLKDANVRLPISVD